MTPCSALQIGPRDEALLAVLDHAPFTAVQLVALSRTFPQPFPDEHTLRRRLRQLAAAGFVQAFPYAVASLGRSPSYFKLARGGYRLLHGTDIPLPSRRYFESIAPAHHHHTQALSEFLVRLLTAAHDRGLDVRRFARENSITIETTAIKLRPDCAFQLVAPGRPPLNFVVELDNGTERVRSQLDAESIERKLRGYHAHQQHVETFDPQRYVVLFITTRSAVRLDSILAAAQALVKNPKRRLILGAALSEFLLNDNPLFATCFRDAASRRVAMIPPLRKEAEKVPASFQRATVAVC
jgi:hypothetical protein